MSAFEWSYSYCLPWRVARKKGEKRGHWIQGVNCSTFKNVFKHFDIFLYLYINSDFIKTQTDVHRVGDAIQLSHPLSSPSPRPQSSPATGSFPMSQFFTSGGQSIRVSALASVLPMTIQDWCPLGWTGWISLQSKGLLRVFSNTTVQKHKFFSAQLSSQSTVHTWLLDKP